MATRFRVMFKDEDLGVFDADDVTMDEALQLEDKTGMTVNDMVTGMAKSSARGTQAIVWFQLRRAGRPAELHQNFKFRDLDIAVLADEPDPTSAVEDDSIATDSELEELVTSGS